MLMVYSEIAFVSELSLCTTPEVFSSMLLDTIVNWKYGSVSYHYAYR